MQQQWALSNEGGTTSISTNLSQESFDRFARFITGELGIKMPESKITMIQSRLLRRARDLRLRSLDEYGNYFFSHPSAEEREHLINAVTTNKTDFFRESEHFDYLVRTALPNVRRTNTSLVPRTNVWSAGCSSGEEPYTLSMVLSEYAKENPGFSFAILATDISTKVLDHARRGVYQESVVGPVSATLRKKYLLRSKDRSSGLVRVAPCLREKISFHQLNFMSESYRIQEMFDVVFFRNVLIYFNRNTQESVVGKICRNIKPGGYLFVGHAESLTGMKVPVSQVKTAVFRMPLSGEKD
jgi:chemotaxis protein methyltransferase CheR